MQKIIWILIASLPLSVFGQNLDPLRDSRKHFFWGIAFTGSSARMKIALDNDFFNQNSMELKKIKPLAQAGGGFGGTVAYRFGKFWELKTQTMLHLHQRDIEYTFINRPKERIKIESITFDIPLALKFRSEMPNNTRLYVLAGLRYSRDFQSNQDLNIGVNKPIVAIKKNTFYYDYGMGFEFRLDFVDLAVEFRMSNAINNALVRIPGSYYSGSLSSLRPRLFGISLLAQN